MEISEIRDRINSNSRYKNFTLLDSPVAFKDFDCGDIVDIVQVHSVQPVLDDIVGFMGAFAFRYGEIISLDGDSYFENMLVYGYEWWENEDEGIAKGLDILTD